MLPPIVFLFLFLHHHHHLLLVLLLVALQDVVATLIHTTLRPRVQVAFVRPKLSKLYPMLVVIGMWGIICAELVIIYSHLVRRWRHRFRPQRAESVF